MTFSSAFHGTTVSISSRKTSRLVFFLLPAYSASAKLICPIAAPPWRNQRLAQRLVDLFRLSLGLVPESGLPLAAKREYEDGVEIGHVAIKRDVTAAAPPDDELSLAITERAADQRIAGKDLDGFEQPGDPLGRVGRGGARDVIEETVEVVEDLGRVLDSRHLRYG